MIGLPMNEMPGFPTKDSVILLTGEASFRHEADYSKGKLYVLAILDNFLNLYDLPEEALNVIRKTLGSQMKVSIEGKGKISLFVYDNITCIAESFLDEPTIVNVVTTKPYKTLTDLETTERLTSTERPAQTRWNLPKADITNVLR